MFQTCVKHRKWFINQLFLDKLAQLPMFLGCYLQIALCFPVCKEEYKRRDLVKCFAEIQI